MDPQPGVGAAASRRARGIRTAGIVPGIAGAPVDRRRVPAAARERELRGRLVGRAGGSKTRAHADGLGLARKGQESGGNGPYTALDREQLMENTMLSPDRVIDFTPLHAATSDYDVVRQAIGFISQQWRKQPEVEEIAHAVGVTATDLHHLFRRWSGLTPKAFLQAI